jgi:CDP-paratose 2-epimerase
MKTIITGGAGFIGSNAASRYLKRGDEVVVVDNLSRQGGEKNLEWLKPQGSLSFIQADIRDGQEMNRVFDLHRDAHAILHLAGQVAVTSSVEDPRADFEANATGTLNVLEAARLAHIKAPIIFSSTNKVYGGMENVGVAAHNGRYTYASLPDGVDEEQNLDFHSPYGCSKGAADQYVRDYSRIYGMKTVVFRQSCIYGYRQLGVEDQGWVAWFTIAAVLNKPITIYGDGKQVRDILFIEDLLDAYDSALRNIDRTSGNVYNIGGGPQNVLSVREVLEFLDRKQNRQVPFNLADWRPGDQRVYISNIAKARMDFGWEPKIDSAQGLDLLYEWVTANTELFGSD